MIDQEVGPGYREFLCINCEYKWRDKCEDVSSRSCLECPLCLELNYPISCTLIGGLH